MKKLLALIISISLLSLSLCSCEGEHDAYGMLREFVSSYGAEGIIYSPTVPEGSDGYVYEGFIEKVYILCDSLSDNYAVFLNSRTDFSSECAIFVCDDGRMLRSVEEMCLERVRLLCPGDDRGFVRTSGRICFYSTMQDRALAEKIFSQIIR